MMILLVFLCTVATSLAQNTVTGKITAEEDGSTLPGVSVSVKGTTRGTTSDANGNYSLAMDAANSTLVFSFIGYLSQEVAVGNRSSVNVTLTADLQALSEVVVTGYTTESKRDFTGAVSTVKAKDIVAIPSGNIEQQLQGRAAGVTVISNGQPGTTSIVRVRGFGAFGGNEPLYVIDGVPAGSSDFVQPDDVESTTVLKDAAAASIYGARAANGVIVITTKKGKSSIKKLAITYDGVYGTTTTGNPNSILNPQETADWTWNAIRNTAFQLGKTPVFDHPQYGKGQTPVLPEFLRVGSNSGVTGGVDLAAERLKYNVNPGAGGIYQVIRANKEGTNWWKEVTRPAQLSRHTLSFAGGNDFSRYYVSLSAQDQKGILLNQDFKRYSFRANTEFNLRKNIRVGENIQLTYRTTRGLIGGEGGRGVAADENDVLAAFRMPSIIPVYDEFGGYAGTAAQGFNNPRNPVAARQRQGNNLNYGTQGFGNIYAEADVIKGLTLRSSIGGGISNYHYNFFSPQSYENSENNASFGYGEGSGFGYNWTFTNTARYLGKFGEHSVDVLTGIEALAGGFRSIDGFGINPFSTDPNYITLTTTSATGRVVNSNNFLAPRFFSIFGKAQYAFRDKYIVTGVLRRDGSSRFGANVRYGVFPAVSGAWRISGEEFMKNIPFVTDLKIRGGWGQMGNSNNVDPNNQFSLFAASVGQSSYDITGSNSTSAEGFYRSRIGNPNAKWETSTNTNIGLDGTFLNGKLELVFDVWRKNTTDLLYTLETPAVVGPVAADPAINIASMINQGIDVLLVNRGKITGDLGYQVDLTGSFLKNQITSLAPGVLNFPAGGSRIGSLIRNEVGGPIASFFGYKVAGLFQTQAEIDASPKQDGVLKTEDAAKLTDTKPNGVGRFRFTDVNGDGVITPADRTFLGSPVPAFTGGINLKLTYRNFELETFLYASLGAEIYRFEKWYTDFYPSFTGAAISRNVLDSWTTTGGGNTVPIFENVSNFSTNNSSNSYYVEDGSFMRLRNVQVAYNLSPTFLGKLGFSKARVYLQATNLFTITKYSGQDPEVGGAVDTSLGIDIGNYPITRGFNIGVNLGF